MMCTVVFFGFEEDSDQIVCKSLTGVMIRVFCDFRIQFFYYVLQVLSPKLSLLQYKYERHHQFFY